MPVKVDLANRSQHYNGPIASKVAQPQRKVKGPELAALAPDAFRLAALAIKANQESAALRVEPAPKIAQVLAFLLENRGEAHEAVAAGADGVLLDEFSPAALMALVPELRQRAAARSGATPVLLEASGVQPDQLQAYAATGIDLISTSAPVTRSRWLDLSMRFEG